MAEHVYHSQSNKLDEMKQTLQGVLDSFHEDPEKIAEMLTFKSRFWNYSLNNSILIQSQNPNATFVASLHDWNKKGYRVKKGQHGIKVLFPIRTELIPLGEVDGKQRYRRVADATPEQRQRIKNGELKTVTFTRFGVGTVFDIAQTDCPPQDYPKLFSMGYSSDYHKALYNAVKQYAEQNGIPVKEEDLKSISLRGAFYPNENEIRISDKLNDTEQLSTLTHELGHALMHNSKEAFKLPEPVRELEADAVSIMLQQYFGISLTDSRKRHFSENYRACTMLKDFKLEDALKLVNTTYQELRKELEPILSKNSFYRQKGEKLEVHQPLIEALINGDALISDYKQFDASDEDAAAYTSKEFNEYQDRLGMNDDEFKAWIYANGQDKSLLLRNICFCRVNGLDFSEYQKNHSLSARSDNPSEAFSSRPKVKSPRHNTRNDYADHDKAVLDYIKHGVSLITVAHAMGFTPIQEGRNYTLKEHDSVKIYPETNSFYQFSSGKGGSPIDFLIAFGGYTAKEAIEKLEKEYTDGRLDEIHATPQKHTDPVPEKKEFVLPEKVGGKYTRVFAYLTKTRCLDADIVKRCMSEGLIYEDSKHNVVFIGKDDAGKPVYATRHTTLTESNFKRDVAGSRQDVGWMVKNGKAEKLYVCEAPIDALSIMTLLKQQGKPFEKASFFATCGTCKDAALYSRLRANPQIKEVSLANDNDEAGQKANEKIYKTLQKDFPGIRVKLCTPNTGKDINECLCKKPKKETAKEQEVER